MPGDGPFYAPPLLLAECLVDLRIFCEKLASLLGLASYLHQKYVQGDNRVIHRLKEQGLESVARRPMLEFCSEPWPSILRAKVLETP